MKTIFFTGFFRERHQTFFQKLTQHFRVITYKGSGFTHTPQTPCQHLEDILAGHQQGLSLERYVVDIHQGLRFVEDELAKLFDNPQDTKLSESEILEFHRTSFNIHGDLTNFRKLLDLTPIDMVLTCTDVDSTKRRGLVVEARHRGIPTVNLEHGFMASQPNLCQQKKEKAVVLAQASEYGIVDNQVEYDVFYKAKEKYHPQTTYFVKGTPVDTPQKDFSNREGSCNALGLDSSKRYITYLGTWWEARDPGHLIKACMADAAFIDDFLKQFAAHQKQHGTELIVKLHPTFSKQPYFNDTQNMWQTAAQKHGTHIAQFLVDKLDHVLAVTDTLVMHHSSSVLWEGVLNKIPSICYFSPYIQSRFEDPSQIKEGSVLYKRDLIRLVLKSEDIWPLVTDDTDPQKRQDFEKRVDELKAEYNLNSLTAADKSNAIIEWMHSVLK